MTAADRARLARVALSRLTEPGHRAVAGAIRQYGPAGLLDRVVEEPRTAVERRLAHRLGDADPWRRAELDLAAADRTGTRVLVPWDEEWPAAALDPLAGLADAEDAPVEPPMCLWVRGQASLADCLARAVAVVGARAASGYGLHIAGELGYGLAERSWTVVSGGAFGIDAAAHRGALGADGLTVAVLACGIDTVYPLGHAALFDRVVASGALVTEWPPGTGPQRHRFLIRNRVIAAFGAGTVVVEAAARSGASVTAARAESLGRTVMAVPGPVTSATSVGTHALIRDGAARLVTSVQDVIEETTPIGEGFEPIPDVAVELVGRERLDPVLARVFEAVPGTRAAPVEGIVAAGGGSPTEVRRSLPQLVMAGLVEQTTVGYRLTSAARAAAGKPEPAPPTVR